MLHESTVKRYEDGQIKSLDIEKMKEFAKALDVSSAWILGFDDPSPIEAKPTTIGDRIKTRRLELGLSVEDLARKIEKNKATVYRYENNEIENFPLSALEPIAKVLKTTPGLLMGSQEDCSLSQPYYDFARTVQNKNISPDDLWLALEFIEKIRK